MRTTRSGSEKGRPRKKRSWIKLNMAVFMPMPMASVMMASEVNPGDLRGCRSANFRSFMFFSPQCFDWINPRVPARGKKTRQESGGSQYHARNEKGERIAWADFV